MKKKPSFSYLLILLVVTGMIASCSQESGKEIKKDPSFDLKKQMGQISADDVDEGKRLSRIYCVRCHAYPDPDLLDKKTWIRQTLPNMGPRLGILTHDSVDYPLENTENLPPDTYPDHKLITNKNWQKILDYYYTLAPKKLKPAVRNKEIIKDPLFFKARMPDYHTQAPPMVTSIRFDPANKVIYLSNASDNKFLVFDEKLEYTDYLNLNSPLSDIRILNEDLDTPGQRDLLLTYIGVLSPSDGLKGSVMRSSYDPASKQADPGYYVINHIERPVESQMADLDQDGIQEILVNEFGHRKGHLFWLDEGEKKNNSVRKNLADIPGCIESEVHDLNEDGMPDVIALCTQADEAIYLFQNHGKGKFTKKTLLKFPVVAGSSSFEMHDFNGDGQLDILYTSGDNADYSSIYKPYHGVYIYLNDKAGHFKKAWFYPVNGAYNAKARDFDRDGDLDIAAISFFADYVDKPEEGFIFFKNEGGLNFTPYHHPATSAGRWITMDVADWTGNGYDDILLGNFSLGPTKVIPEIQQKWTSGPYFLLLENHPDADSN